MLSIPWVQESKKRKKKKKEMRGNQIRALFSLA
jgi:hypothetical protein